MLAVTSVTPDSAGCATSEACYEVFKKEAFDDKELTIAELTTWAPKIGLDLTKFENIRLNGSRNAILGRGNFLLRGMQYDIENGTVDTFEKFKKKFDYYVKERDATGNFIVFMYNGEADKRPLTPSTKEMTWQQKVLYVQNDLKHFPAISDFVGFLDIPDVNLEDYGKSINTAINVMVDHVLEKKPQRSSFRILISLYPLKNFNTPLFNALVGLKDEVPLYALSNVLLSVSAYTSVAKNHLDLLKKDILTKKEVSDFEELFNKSFTDKDKYEEALPGFYDILLHQLRVKLRCEFPKDSSDALVDFVNEKAKDILFNNGNIKGVTYNETERKATVILKKEIKLEDLQKIGNTGLFDKLRELGVKEVKFEGDADFVEVTDANVKVLRDKMIALGERLNRSGKGDFSNYIVKFDAKIKKADCVESEPIPFEIEIQREAYPRCEFPKASGDELATFVSEAAKDVLAENVTYDANNNTAKVVLKKEIKDEDLKKIKNTGLFAKLGELGVKEVKFTRDTAYIPATPENLEKLAEKLVQVGKGLEAAGKNKFEYKVEFEAKVEKADCLESDPIKFVIEIEREAYTYTVDFVDGTSSFLKKEVVHNNVVDKPTKNPEKAGYRFVGWFADKDFKNQFDFTKPITAHTTIYVKWNRISSGGGG